VLSAPSRALEVADDDERVRYGSSGFNVGDKLEALPRSRRPGRHVAAVRQ
jgi:hypothetical protein